RFEPFTQELRLDALVDEVCEPALRLRIEVGAQRGSELADRTLGLEQRSANSAGPPGGERALRDGVEAAAPNRAAASRSARSPAQAGSRRSESKKRGRGRVRVVVMGMPPLDDPYNNLTRKGRVVKVMVFGF